MGFKRNFVEAILSMAARPRSPRNNRPPSHIGKIFVLRNNGIGDLLVTTPLFEALNRCLPGVRIVAGIGSWNLPVLKNNPYVSEILSVNAPWHNLNSCKVPHNSVRGLVHSLQYVFRSVEVDELTKQRFDVGIDVLGSPEGSLLMLKARIPYRLGVRGYAGGHSSAQLSVEFDPNEHVGRSALRFAELLGAKDLPEVRPQIFLDRTEENEAEHLWHELCADVSKPVRFIIGTGGGFREKCWPIELYEEVVGKLTTESRFRIAVVGGPEDVANNERLAAIAPSVRNFAGKLSLRQTFALVAKADFIVCNSSMLMHVAAAFSKPTVVVLGGYFPSAKVHARQWGYENLSRVLGKDVARNHIYSAEEVLEVIRSMVRLK